jgi:hypothetical protein
MRAYTVAASAFTLGVNTKWLDNVLSLHRVKGVFQQRQGISRRLTPAALLTIEIAARLGRAFAIPLGPALEIAAGLIEAGGKGIEIPEALAIRISADIDVIARELNDRLERAVEISPTPKRGRPRRK